MGQMVVKTVLADKEMELVAAVDIKAHEDVGLVVGTEKCGVAVSDNLAKALEESGAEVMIDFTRPSVVFDNVMTALQHHVSPVVGTTGLSKEQQEEIRQAAEREDTPAFIAPNFAIGAVLLMVLSAQAAKYMPEVEIIELHHDQKLDAPSGTAVQTANMIAEVRKAHGQGHPEEKEKEGYEGARGADYEGMHVHSVRLPGYIASQEVIFGGLGQTLTIRHDTTSRESFMPGVALAAKKVRNLKGLTIGLDKLL
jgi:4-hydroxy-tetrahydrodipicolinate reductase